MRQQTSVRLSKPAARKLAALARLYENKTTVIEIAIDRLYQQEAPLMNPLAITILTDSITRDSLDPHVTLSDDAWARERERYIEMLIAATQARYPHAEIDTAPGNGMDTVKIYGPSDCPAENEGIEDELYTIWQRVYENWSETLDDCQQNAHAGGSQSDS